FLWPRLSKIINLHILQNNQNNRLGVISFTISGLHHYMAVKILNDRFGIQTRGGCACAGTYGHFLFQVDQEKSSRITNLISEGDNSIKPGWVRMSLHPTMTNEELEYIVESIESLAENYSEWQKAYKMDLQKSTIECSGLDESNIKGKIDACLDNNLTCVTEFS